GSSSCTCPVHKYCKHLAAVMMELADRLGYPASQIVNAKHHVKRLQMVPPAKPLLNQLSGMDVAGWHQFLDQATSHVVPGYDLGRYIDLLRAQLNSILKNPIPLSEVDRIFFALHQQ